MKTRRSGIEFDLRELLSVIGESALHSTWLCGDVDCFGRGAAELREIGETFRSISGRELLSIAEWIEQTFQGCFRAYTDEVSPPWLVICATGGAGFEIKSRRPEIIAAIKKRFSHGLIIPEEENMHGIYLAHVPLKDVPTTEPDPIREIDWAGLSQRPEPEVLASAIQWLKDLIQQQPDNALVHTSLGVAWRKSGSNHNALECFDTALRHDPSYAEAYYFRANVQFSLGRMPEATAGYTLAMGLQPSLINAHHLALPANRLTDYTSWPAQMYWIFKPAQHILEFDQVLQTQPEARIYRERGKAYYDLWNYNQACSDFTICLELKPEEDQTLIYRALAYERLHQFASAMADYHTFLNRKHSPQVDTEINQRLNNLVESMNQA